MMVSAAAARKMSATIFIRVSFHECAAIKSRVLNPIPQTNAGRKTSSANVASPSRSINSRASRTSATETGRVMT